MKEVKLGQIVNSQEALNVLLAKEIKVSTAFKLRKIVKLAEIELKLYNEMQAELLKEYGTEIEGEAGQYKFEDGNYEIFISKMDELTNSDIELPINEITIDELSDIELTTIQLISLEWLIQEDNE